MLSPFELEAYVPFLATAEKPASVAEAECPEMAFEPSKDNLAETPCLESALIKLKFGAGLGANILRTSLNLSTAVPIGVDVAKSVNSPSA